MHPPDLQSLTLEGWTVLSSVGYPFSSFFWGGAFGEDVFSGPIAPPFSNLFPSFLGFFFLSSPLCISRMSCWASGMRAFLRFFLLCRLRYLKKCSKYFFLHYHCFRRYILHRQGRKGVSSRPLRKRSSFDEVVFESKIKIALYTFVVSREQLVCVFSVVLLSYFWWR